MLLPKLLILITKRKEYSGVLTIISHEEIKKMNINPMYPGFKVKNKDGSDMLDTFRNILSDGKVIRLEN